MNYLDVNKSMTIKQISENYLFIGKLPKNKAPGHI